MLTPDFAAYAAEREQQPSRPSAFDWSGLYAGGHVGYGFSNSRNTLADPLPVSGSDGSSRGVGGVQVGYNVVLPSRLMLGIEADATIPYFFETDDVMWSRAATSGNTLTEHLDYIATLRGRVGYAFDNTLIYATGGHAWSQSRFIESPGVVTDDDKRLAPRTGWTVGAGIERALDADWSARFEYAYDKFSRSSVTMPSGVTATSDLDVHLFRVGLNRKLRWPGDSASDAERIAWPAAQYDRWNIHGQYTAIGQGYGSFRAPYSGASSLNPAGQFKNTQSATAFIGFSPWDGGEFYVNPELMQGFGLSDVRGVAGFPNGEAQKSNFPYPRLNIARAFYRHTFGLGGEQEAIEDGPNQTAGKQDISRITVTIGKFAATDYFDGNSYANDPRTSFLNWNVYGGGAYDWTMDKLSWTWGAVAEFNQKHWAVRAGYFLLPEVANSNSFDTEIGKRGEYALEGELRYALMSQPGKVRLFGWVNHGIMGGYADALALPTTSTNYPDLAATRRVRTNYGVVFNVEQAITTDLGVFSRASWSPGEAEIVGWTDVHRALSAGSVLKGTAWSRPDDRIGIAGVIEALSPVGRRYFGAGGIGILIGDGQLNYREEQIFETYYAYKLNRFTTVTFDYQHIANPAYNADRGPVSFYSARLHAEF